MGYLDNILTCSLVASVADLQVLGYRRTDSGVYDAAGSRTGTAVTLTIDAEIAAEDAEALVDALDDLAGAVEAAEGATFSVSAFGAVKEQLYASKCLAGPHVRVDYAEAGGHNLQPLTITVEATVYTDTADGVLSAASSVSTRLNAEDLRVLTTSGECRTTGSPAASSVVVNGIPPDRPALIGACPSGWKQESSYRSDARDQVCTYEITQTELVAGYPVDPQDATQRVVDGERTITSAFDAHNRRITTYEYRYSGPYAEAYVAGRHTALRQAGGLRSASISITAHAGRQVTGRFEVLSQREGDELLELSEEFSHARTGPLLREVRYPGTGPLIVADQQSAWVYEQTGRAVGLGRYPKPPAGALAAANLAEQPSIVLSRTDDSEFVTTWRYRWLFATEQQIQQPHDRGDATEFYP